MSGGWGYGIREWWYSTSLHHFYGNVHGQKNQTLEPGLNCTPIYQYYDKTIPTHKAEHCTLSLFTMPLFIATYLDADTQGEWESYDDEEY